MRKFKIRYLSPRQRKALAILVLLELESKKGSSVVKERVRRRPTHPLIQEREKRGEFAILVEQARESYEDIFSEYFHMSRATFEHLLSILQVMCFKTCCG
jgi:hypothetical protein